MSSKIWYVYKIQFENGKFYFGYRGSKNPTEDFLQKYTSSSKIVKALMADGVTFAGEILHTFSTQLDALNCEQELIFNHFADPMIINRSCRFGVAGYGLLTNDAKEKISTTSKARWADPEYKARLSEAHKKRWADNPDLKKAQSARLTGKLRPEHSEKLTGRAVSTETKQKMRKPKHPGFGEKVSLALKGRVRTEEHKQNLRKPNRLVCRIMDKKLMDVANFTKWINKITPPGQGICSRSL